MKGGHWGWMAWNNWALKGETYYWDDVLLILGINGLYDYMGVEPKNRATPKSSHFNRVFHYKPSILGYPYFWKQPYVSRLISSPK